jgi:hypothetical protein
MAQDLTVNIKTTSDVPQAMDKAKSATVSFTKQLDDIQKKFSTAFKDLALAFVAPLVILNAVIRTIQASFEKNRQNMAEAMKFAELGESRFISAEARYLAAEKKRREVEGSSTKAQAGEEELIKDFLRNDPRTAEIMKKLSPGTVAGLAQAQARETLNPFADEGEKVLEYAVKNLEIRKAVLDIIKKEMATGGSGPSSLKDFKGPEGFGNVIGVGANPVMEAMNAQLEEQKKTNTILEKIAGDPGATSWMNSTPSRAALLMGK